MYTYKHLLYVLLTVFSFKGHAQTIIAGDTTGRLMNIIDSEYLVGGSMGFSIGCDSVDVWISSTSQGQFTWARLNMVLKDSVYVSYRQGLVAHYLTGEPISTADSTWTPYFDFIWGNGGMGQYGNNKIDTSYLAFRKITGTDTNYLFIKVSTRDNAFKIHQVISDCNINPFSVISNIEDITNEAIRIFPNPVASELQIDYSGNYKGYIVNMQGSLIQHLHNVNRVNVATLPAGLYLLYITSDDGKKAFRRFIKN